MSRRRRPLAFLLAMTLFALGSLGTAKTACAQEDEDISNEYRITLFPHFPLHGDRLSGFGYLGYVTNPDKDYRLYYLGWPGVLWTVKPRVLQVWTGLIGIYTANENEADKLELRPFAGFKAFLPNGLKWNIYNFTRYEYRVSKESDADHWSDTARFRSRFGVELPLTSRAHAWRPKTFYALFDAEPFYAFDRESWYQFRLRGGLGYVFEGRCRAEFIYHAQFTRPNGPLVYTDNIFRLNIKIGLKHGVLPRAMDSDFDE